MRGYVDKVLLIAGCSIFVVLGTWHAVLVLFTTVFEPTEKTLLETLKNSQTKITKTGNMWSGSQGFHLSHSLGLVVYGGLFIALASENYAYLKSSTVLSIALFSIASLYIFLASKYWFSVPRNAFIIAFGLLATSLVFR